MFDSVNVNFDSLKSQLGMTLNISGAVERGRSATRVVCHLSSVGAQLLSILHYDPIPDHELRKLSC